MAAVESASLPEAVRRGLTGVRWTPALVDQLIRDMPKVETHVHLDGALPPQLIKDLAVRQGFAPLAGLNLDQIRKLSVVDKQLSSLQDVLDVFPVVFPLLEKPEAIERVAYEVVVAAHEHNVRHVEVRFAPAIHATPRLSSTQVLEAARRGLERGRHELEVSSGLIVCLIRPFSAMSREKNDEMLDLAIRYAGKGVVGIDLAGNEAAQPLADFREHYLRAKAAGLRTTAHAGEVPGSRDLETALLLGLDRIGHATMLARDQALLARVAAKRIPVEVNLTSNLRTGAVRDYREHVVKKLYAAGIPIALSTDDPGVFAIDIDHEYQVLVRHLGFGPDDVVAVSFHGIGALFLPEAEKKALRERFESELVDLLRRLGLASR